MVGMGLRGRNAAYFQKGNSRNGARYEFSESLSTSRPLIGVKPVTGPVTDQYSRVEGHCVLSSHKLVAANASVPVSLIAAREDRPRETWHNALASPELGESYNCNVDIRARQA
ncbi:Activator of stress1 [Fusarium oxysporum f. sp. albedinis]|nr:Uncharacterized protein HZ326_29197 [Fusarium oxysporum f. sp. albedinis]KAJ0133931.1 Activator of stress1 [Fusarium oxysporum f. sp. albedinis]